MSAQPVGQARRQAGRGMYVKLDLWAGFYWARYRLYRNQILQEYTRWKALDEIYKIYLVLHRSNLNISANFRRIVWRFRN